MIFILFSVIGMTKNNYKNLDVVIRINISSIRTRLISRSNELASHYTRMFDDGGGKAVQQTVTQLTLKCIRINNIKDNSPSKF